MLTLSLVDKPREVVPFLEGPSIARGFMVRLIIHCLPKDCIHIVNLWRMIFRLARLFQALPGSLRLRLMVNLSIQRRYRIFPLMFVVIVPLLQNGNGYIDTKDKLDRIFAAIRSKIPEIPEPNNN